MLGFVDEKSPLADLSTTKRNALLDEMLEACRGYICTDFLETLRERVAEELPNFDSWQLVIDHDDRDVINFMYPTTTEKVEYVPPAVRLELGTHAEFIPNDRYSIRPYAADPFSNIFEDPVCTVQAIKVERTFWEKATILHQEHYRTIDRGAPTRLSRHYYDVFMMADHHEILQGALRSPELLTRVVEHKIRFYPRAWARYDLAVPTSLQLLRVLSASLTDFRRRRLVSLATQRKGVARVTKEKQDKRIGSGRESPEEIRCVEAESQGSVADSGTAVDIGGGCSEGRRGKSDVQGATTGLLRAETTSRGFDGNAICKSE